VARVDPSAVRGRLRWWPNGLSQTEGGANLDPARRVAAAHAGALLATLIVLAVDGGDTQAIETLVTGLLIFGGFAVLRVRSAGRLLAPSTLVLDAVGTTLLLAGTGAPVSAYIFLALAGAWWAAHVPRRSTGLLWAAAFVVAYGILVMPGAIRGRDLVSALEDISVVVIVGLLADSFVRVDQRAIQLSETLTHAPAGAAELAIREGLTRALGPMEVSLDVLLAAARAGLTLIQAELLAYLQLGLTNQEIADATKVGEATVRYRLTGLYRAMGVRGRKAAVERAMELAFEFVATGRPPVVRP
jgi:DNA-binding CsgD family transcriptional regulator